MKTHQDIRHEGTLSSDRVKMTFDENSVTFLMSVLTDMYADPEMAVIREYSTNAWDSHVAAGITDPIEISLPTSLRPEFIVRDHGVGMSVYDITDHFSKYGWSSKRDSDSEVGMLGLGCKSGLTYSSQFTITAIKDGVKCLALVTRDEDGAGAVQIIEIEESSEHNGVEVAIPVRSVSGFCGKAQEFFSYWRPMSGEPGVLIDGQEPVIVDGLWIDPDICIQHDKTYAGRDIVVMGNVPYELQEGRIVRNEYQKAIVWVPIGSVDFTPSREQLHMTKRTKDVIATARDYITHAYWKSVQDSLQECENKAEAYKFALDHRKYTRNKVDWKYQGELIPNGITVEYLAWQGNSSYNTTRHQSITQSNGKTIRIYGHHTRCLTEVDKIRIRTWMEAKGIVATHYDKHAVQVFAEVNDWLDGWVPWDEVVAANPKPEKVKRVKKPDTWEVINRAGNLMKADTVDTTGDLVYITRQEEYRGKWSDYGWLMNKLNVPFAVVPTNKLDKFLKTYPHALPVREYAQAIGYLYAINMTDDYKHQIALSKHMYGSMRRAVGCKFADPALSVFQLTLDSTEIDLFARMGRISRVDIEVPDLEGLENYLDTEYPLMRYCDGREVARYANAMYLARMLRV